MPGKSGSKEQGVVLAVVLMVLAALSLLAIAGKGAGALQWMQVRNSLEYAEALQLAETGIGKALAANRYSLAAAQSGRYCRIPSRCVEWTVRHVETTPVPAGLQQGTQPARALHFEVAAEGRAGARARAPVVAGFLLIAPGAPQAPLPAAIDVCTDANQCPEDSAGPPIRRYWREAAIEW